MLMCRATFLLKATGGAKFGNQECQNPPDISVLTCGIPAVFGDVFMVCLRLFHSGLRLFRQPSNYCRCVPSCADTYIKLMRITVECMNLACKSILIE